MAVVPQGNSRSTQVPLLAALLCPGTLKTLGHAGTLLVCASSLGPQVATAQVFLLWLWGIQISLQRNQGLYNMFVILLF